jgi:hypothetical protein
MELAKRWTEDDILRLKDMAGHYAVPFIAEKMDRSVGGVVFKAHQLKIGLRSRNRVGDSISSLDPGPDGFDLDVTDDFERRTGVTPSTSR